MPAERRPSRLSEADRAIWADFAQSLRAEPVRKPAPQPPSAPSAPPALPRPPARPDAVTVGDAPAGLDTGSWQRFRSGRLRPARSLDLHGRTAQEAHHALRHFLQTANRDRLRCVEIITGRGAGETGGVLRRELPLWLNLPDIRPLILAATHPHLANPGAVRLLLRRPR